MHIAGASRYRSNENIAQLTVKEFLDFLTASGKTLVASGRLQEQHTPQKLAETPASLKSFFSSPDPYFAFVSALAS